MYITVSVLRAIAENSISLEKLTKEVEQLKSLLLRVLENSTSAATNIIDLPDDIVLPMSTLNDVDIMEEKLVDKAIRQALVSYLYLNLRRSRDKLN